MRCIVLLFLLLSTLAEWSVLAQGTQADYQRAAQLRSTTRNRVTNLSLDVVWTSDEDGDSAALWFMNEETGENRSVIRVDPQTGKKRIVLDAAGVVEAVQENSGQMIDAAEIRITSIEAADDGQGIVILVTGGEKVTLHASADGRNVQVLPAGIDGAGGTVGGLVARAPSPDLRSGGSTVETSITFVNQMELPVRAFWINAQGQRTQYARIGPGGSHSQHTFASHVWLVTTDDEQPLAMYVATQRAGMANITGPAAESAPPETRRPAANNRRSNNRSPDDRYEVFIRDNNAHLKEVATGDERALSTTGSADDRFGGRAYWSPDSSRVVIMQTVPPQEHKVFYVESSPSQQVQPRLQSYDYLKPGDRIAHPRPRLFDVASGEAIAIDEALFDNPWSINNMHWAADSSAFYFLYNQRGHQAMRIIRVDATTGEARAIINEEPDTFFNYSNKTFLRYLNDSNDIVWMSERDGWNHLYLVDMKTGSIKHQITKGEWLVRGVDRVDINNRQLWFRVMGFYKDQDPYHIHHARIDLDGGNLKLLTDGDGTHEIEYSPDGEYIIDTFSRVDMPPIYKLRRVSDGTLVCELARGDFSSLVEDAGWQVPERFVTTGRDNTTDIWGLIFRPTNFDPSKKYPIIESIYAGPHGQHVPKSFRPYYSEQSLAELGFIVVKIDGMGTNWRSKQFHDYCWKDIADAGFPDRKIWIRAAALKYPSMDTSRVGIFGGSAGGQNAMRALLDHHDLYSVAVADCGCHDNRMDKIWWNEAWMGWPVDESYESSSNVVDAHQLQGQLLLTVGEADRNVDPASTMQVVAALIKANKNFDLIVFPGGGHGAGGSAYGRRRMEDFFVQHLHGVQPQRGGD